MQGISIRKNIAIGDALQFSSVPENYFRATGERLVDVSEHWFFDHNPYVARSVEPSRGVTELWNYGPTQRENPKPRTHVYLSNAEIGAATLNVPVVLNRPRLYCFENFPIEERETVLVQTRGRSHGDMPENVMAHVRQKYKNCKVYQVGLPDEPAIGFPRMITKDLWALAEVISECRLFIGMDSGPSWIAACYPDVVVKKIRTRPNLTELMEWVPLEISNIHSHWDDRMFQIFNCSEDDVGFTQSYQKL